MRGLSICSLILPTVASLFLCNRLESQSKSDLAERLRLAAEATRLDSAGSTPFHLKLSVEILPQKGRLADKGTVEMWWNAPEQNRTVYDLSQYHATVVHTSAGLFRTADAGGSPYIVDHLLAQVLHPVSNKLNSTDFRMEAVKQPFGKTQLNCIVTSSSSLKEFLTTFCFDDQTQLRVILENPDQYNLRQTLVTVGNRHLSMTLQYTFLHNVVATAHIDSLESRKTAYPEASDTADLRPVPAPPASVPGSMLAGRLLRKPDPVYPQAAMEKHVSGTVLLHGIIGVDGKVTKLSLIGSPDDSLSSSAMEAVAKWVYQPYMLNDVATEVDTTVTVHYTFALR